MMWRVDAVAANMGAMAAMASSKWRNRPPNNERKKIYLPSSGTRLCQVVPKAPKRFKYLTGGG